MHKIEILFILIGSHDLIFLNASTVTEMKNITAILLLTM